MAISFPSNPSLNEVYLYNGTQYVWDGVKWISGGRSTYDELYLSKVSDDAAAGNVTFEADLIVSSGSVGVGTTNPAKPLHAKSAVDEILRLETPDNQTGNIYQSFHDSTGELASVGMFNSMQELRLNNLQSDGLISFRTNSAERMRIDDSGNAGIGTSDPAVELDVNGQVRAAQGILFGSDTAAVNALNDYEEGDWTPEYIVTNGTLNCTYDNQGGKYVKIGRVVHCEGRLRTDAVSGDDGNIRIAGLPFLAAGGTLARAALDIGACASFRSGFHRPTEGLLLSDKSEIALYRATQDSYATILKEDLETSINSNNIQFSITYRTFD